MIGLIGGTGLGDALLGESASGSAAREHVVETPFGHPSGPIRVTNWNGLDLAILARHGDGHTLNPTQVPYRANIFALKTLGVTHILASGAVGSLREHIKPRDLVIVDQVIDKTVHRPATFFDDRIAVHVEFAHPYCRRMRDLLLSVARQVQTTVHDRGTYVCMEGPAFSTVAESNLHRAWGGDVIGMTSMPEAKLAREAEICYAAIALPTDYDCWRPHTPGTSAHALLAEIIENLKEATANAIALMRAAIAAFAESPPPPCECQRALELGIWTDRRKIPPEKLLQLAPLLRKYAPAQ